MSSPLRPLRYRAFAATFYGNFISLAGTWMQTIAVAAYVANETGEAKWVGLATVAGFLPLGLFSPFGGVLADRFDLRRGIVLLNFVEAIIAATTAAIVMTHHQTPINVIVLVFLLGSADALRIPFVQALQPTLVPKEDLVEATSLGATQYNLGRVAGPFLAAVVMGIGGYGLAITVNAISFIGPIVAMLFVPKISVARAPRNSGPFSQVLEGLREANRVKPIRNALILISLRSFCVAPFIGFVSYRARELAHHSGAHRVDVYTALLTTAQGLGSVAGALLIGTIIERIGRRNTEFGFMIVFMAALTAYALAPNIALALLFMFPLGFAYLSLILNGQTILQLQTRPEFRGRVLSLWLTALGVLFPVGVLVQGPIADRFGLAETTLSFAAVAGAITLAVALVRPRFFAALDWSSDHKVDQAVSDHTFVDRALVEAGSSELPPMAPAYQIDPSKTTPAS